MYFGTRANNHIRGYAVHRIRITGLTDADNTSVANTDVCFDDAEFGINNHHVGDCQIQHARIVARCRAGLRHTVAHAFATAKFAFVAFGQ